MGERYRLTQDKLQTKQRAKDIARKYIEIEVCPHNSGGINFLWDREGRCKECTGHFSYDPHP